MIIAKSNFYGFHGNNIVSSVVKDGQTFKATILHKFHPHKVSTQLFSKIEHANEWISQEIYSITEKSYKNY